MQQPSAPDIDTRLKEYRQKRDFRKTLEPSGADAAVDAGCLYVMHKHAASHDHFDLRLEQDGVLRSWALPKGASLEPGEKRLAVEVEDHPLEYGGFEGVIPKDQYGGGTVMLWDAGSWKVNGRNKEGHIDFILDGQKLKGAWTLVRTRMKKGRGKEGRNWLLIKRSDTPQHSLRPNDESVATGRRMEEIAEDRDNIWIKGEARARETVEPPGAGRIHGAKRKPFPKALEPQLATPVDDAPAGDEWIHEIKVDGYRVMAYLDRGKVRLLTRNGHDWTHRFPEAASRLKAIPAKRAVLDGEMTVLLRDGSTSFRKLQEALSAKRTEGVVYQAFDLLYLDEHDLADAALLDRKQALQQLLEAAGPVAGIRYSDHIRGQGPEFFGQACELGLEGIISKRADAPYRGGRGRQWLKVKCATHEEFVVGGFTQPEGRREGFGSLLLGAWDGDDFVYAGRTGTGFSIAQIRRIHEALTERETGSPPFVDEVPDSRGARWARPELVVEVEFTERTRDGRLRHPVFRGLRDDRDPREITVNRKTAPDPAMRTEMPAERSPATRQRAGTTVAGVRITHPDRVMYPELGITKRDLATYYEDIREWILPLIAGHPLSLLRCPEGWQEECFFQKHPGSAIAKGVPRVSVKEKKGRKQYVYVRKIADVIALVQAGTLEFHAWGSHVDDVERPDTMVFDLDPSPGIPWSEVLRTATGLRDRLDALGLRSFARTTGGKGFHLVVPLEPEAGWDAVKDFAKAVSEQHAREDPKRLTTNMSKAKRRNRIFIDYLRNGRGATAIASYSLRAREGAPAAVPVRWDELGEALRADRYNIENLRRRLGALKTDPWEGFSETRQRITAGMRKAVGLEGAE